MQFLKIAKKKKAIIIYDPNFRKQHLHELQALKSMIEENISLANIIRGSYEDFSFIFGTKDVDETYAHINDKQANLLFTISKKGVFLKTPKLNLTYPIRKIDPVSTIGAGDNFNAGIVYSLFKNNIRYKEINSLNEITWKQIIETAVSFATHVCLRYDNYISKEFALQYKL